MALTVQNYLDTVGGLPSTQISGGNPDTGYTYTPLSGFGDISTQLNTASNLYGGKTPLEFLKQYGVTDPLNQLDFVLPDPKKGSLFDDLDWLAPVAAFAGPALFSTLGGLGGVSGASGALGGAEAIAGAAGIPELGLVATPGTAAAATAAGIPASMLSGGAGALTLAGTAGSSGGGMFDWMKSFLPGGGGSSGGMPWNSLMSLAQMATGAFGFNKAGDLQKAAQQAAASMDPFGAYRPASANALFSLINDPSKIEGVPGYQSGLRGVQRALAAQGFNPGRNSATGEAIVPGNWSNGLANYAGNFYNQELSRLMQMAGVGIPPGGGNIALQGAIGSTQLQGQALQSLMAGIYGLLKG